MGHSVDLTWVPPGCTALTWLLVASQEFECERYEGVFDARTVQSAIDVMGPVRCYAWITARKLVAERITNYVFCTEYVDRLRSQGRDAALYDVGDRCAVLVREVAK